MLDHISVLDLSLPYLMYFTFIDLQYGCSHVSMQFECIQLITDHIQQRVNVTELLTRFDQLSSESA